MGPNGIPLDKAELLSVILEALLYGFSLLMFGGTICTLVFQRSNRKLNHKMLMVACALLLCSTVHIVIDIIRVMEGLIFYRDTYPSGPIAFFADVSQWTFVAKNYVYVAQTLIGDGVVLYRCYMVWQSKLVMIVPVLLWCGTVVTGIGSPYIASKTMQNGVFDGILARWITAFWVTALSTNLVATLLFIGRIWYIDCKIARLFEDRESSLRPIVQIFLDAGAIYTVTMIVSLISFVTQSNGQYVLLSMVTPIISITFYMVIIRVGLSRRVQQLTNDISLVVTSMDDDRAAGKRRQSKRLQVHITTLSESKIDQSQRLAVYPLTPTGSGNGSGEVKIDIGAEDAVWPA